MGTGPGGIPRVSIPFPLTELDKHPSILSQLARFLQCLRRLELRTRRYQSADRHKNHRDVFRASGEWVPEDLLILRCGVACGRDEEELAHNEKHADHGQDGRGVPCAEAFRA
jgi:hypothetical protein